MSQWQKRNMDYHLLLELQHIDRKPRSEATGKMCATTQTPITSPCPPPSSSRDTTRATHTPTPLCRPSNAPDLLNDKTTLLRPHRRPRRLSRPRGRARRLLRARANHPPLATFSAHCLRRAIHRTALPRSKTHAILSLTMRCTTRMSARIRAVGACSPTRGYSN